MPPGSPRSSRSIADACKAGHSFTHLATTPARRARFSQLVWASDQDPELRTLRLNAASATCSFRNPRPDAAPAADPLPAYSIPLLHGATSVVESSRFPEIRLMRMTAMRVRLISRDSLLSSRRRPFCPLFMPRKPLPAPKSFSPRSTGITSTAARESILKAPARLSISTRL